MKFESFNIIIQANIQNPNKQVQNIIKNKLMKIKKLVFTLLYKIIKFQQKSIVTLKIVHQMNTTSIINLQQKYVVKFIAGISRHQYVPKQIISLIIVFLFASPFRVKNTFLLKKGIYSVKFTKQIQLNSLSNNFYLKNCDQNIISTNKQFKIKQNDRFLIGNNYVNNQRVKIVKIWNKPATKTQKKLLTYCIKFKQFLLGIHNDKRNINIHSNNRKFLISEFEKDSFEKDFNNIEKYNANFCSFDVIDSYMNLIQKNYLEIQLENNQFNDNPSSRNLKVIVQEHQQQFLPSLKLIFDQFENRWMFKGQKIVIWKQQKVFSQRIELTRNIDGRVDLIQGNLVKSVQQMESQNE